MQQDTFFCPASDDGKEMIEQLKEKFEKSEEKNAKLQVLTILPKSWSILNLKYYSHTKFETNLRGSCPNIW